MATLFKTEQTNSLEHESWFFKFWGFFFLPFQSYRETNMRSWGHRRLTTDLSSRHIYSRWKRRRKWTRPRSTFEPPLPDLEARLGLQAELPRAGRAVRLLLLRMHNKPFHRADRKGREWAKEESEERKGRCWTCSGQTSVTEHAAWVMAFTHNSQRPRPLIRLLNASRINTPRGWNTHPWTNFLPFRCLPGRKMCWWNASAVC